MRGAHGARFYLALTLAVGAGCQDGGDFGPPEPGQPALSGSFIPVYRDVAPDTLERRAAALTTGGAAGPVAGAPGQDFYLAIHKKELASRWFLAAYLTQAAPQGASSGAARSMGTRVVSFKVQNGKLFMFDASAHTASSDVFRPELLLEAYPIVAGYGPFERQRGSSDYLLIDPAGGLNRFRLLQDTGLPIEIDLSFSQRFRRLADGASFEQVFSGSPRLALAAGSVPARVTGTLSIALRRYAEGDGYTEVPMPAREHYFRSPSRLIRNEGTTGFVAARWNIRPGAPPIVWKIAPLGEQLRQHPAFADVDFTGAIKAGIESWNEAFGWKALEARLADPGESFGDDDVNYYIFDSVRNTASAFANWRSNPNTGEIRGASVWFALGWLRATMDLPPAGNAPPPGADAELSGETIRLADPAGAAGPALAWGSASEESLCDMSWPDLGQVLADATEGAAPLTRKERIERLVGHIAAHEIGHTLGLRHNFKGWLQPLSSSVMEYIDIADSVTFGARIGSYDIAAIRYLYGLSDALPPQPFCNDQEADVVDPDCRRRDRGPRPLTDFFVPTYQRSLQELLAARTNSFSSPGNLTAHLRLGASLDVRREAYQGAFGPLRSQEVPAGAHPTFVPRLNAVTQLALRQLFLEPLPGQAPVNGQLVVPPPALPLHPEIIADLAPLLVNADGLRFGSTRRLVVDVLKKFQSPFAFAALEEARAEIAASLTDQSGPAAAETRDLLHRIDRALGSYFE